GGRRQGLLLIVMCDNGEGSRMMCRFTARTVGGGGHLPAAWRPRHAFLRSNPVLRTAYMNHELKGLKSTASITFVGGKLVIKPAFAQHPAPQEPVAQSQPAGQHASTLDTIVVTGLRNSLENSMGIKRDTSGVVDAISAEDIGKFPDTNLAESLQR